MSQSRTHTDVPHYSDLLSFLDLCTQASEGQSESLQRKHPRIEHRKNTSESSVFALTTSVSEAFFACKVAKHPHYSYPTLHLMPHGEMVSLLKSHNLCLNCMKSGHFVRHCPSLSQCRCCQSLATPHSSSYRVDWPFTSECIQNSYTFHCGQQ